MKNLVSIMMTTVFAATTLVGCSQTPTAESVAEAACDVFYRHIESVESAEDVDRQTLVEQISAELAKIEGSEIAPAFAKGLESLKRATDSPASHWDIAVDTFARRCAAAGFDG